MPREKKDGKVRVNFYMSPENGEYCKAMAQSAGLSVTEFLNIILDKHRKEHGKEYGRIKKLRDSI